MAQYQTFPGADGASRTVEKLMSLKLPDMAGRRFLDVGCNEGFFCGFAKFQGASRSMGLDKSKLFLDRARLRFPDCEFLLQGWETLPDGEFDVILLASALHYADDQPALIRDLVGKLSKDGVLVVELGIVSSRESEWQEVERGIDRRFFPSMQMLRQVLADYAWKWMGPSVAQQGDPVPRHVVHISRRKPVAYLLMQPPGYGKTSVASSLFLPAGVPVVSGDEQLARIARGAALAGSVLKQAVDEEFSPYRIDRLIRRIFTDGASGEFISLCASQANGGDLALDLYVPAEYHGDVEAKFAELGFLPVHLRWDRAGPPPQSTDALAACTEAFLGQLEGKHNGGDAAKLMRGMGLARGFVDEIAVESGKVLIRGWAVDASGELPSRLTVRVNGCEQFVEEVEAYPRDDVRRRLKLPHAMVGYRLMLEAPDVRSLADIDAGFEVSVSGQGRLELNARVRQVFALRGAEQEGEG